MTEFVWAVDPQVSYLAFAYAPVGDGLIEVETLITRCEWHEGERLASIHRQVEIFGRQAAGSFAPACVWVEQPIGTHPKPQLMYVAGVVQAALFEALGGVPVWTVPTSTWKKNSVGYGNASKEQVRAWVLRQDQRPATQDECDAYAMACAGRAMFVERRWEVLPS